MQVSKKNIKYYFIIFFFIFLIFYLITEKYKKEKDFSKKPILINLLTSVHSDLSWNFTPVKSKILIKPGEVTTIEYNVENLGNKDTTGIATFVYFPNEFGSYISKINCFCYDAQTLKAKQKDKFTLVIFIDPKVTKDSKTKSVKEATIQFTFFDFKKYKENES